VTDRLDLLLLLAPPVWVPEAPPMGLTYLHEHALAEGLSSRVLDLNERVYTLGGAPVREFWKMGHHADLVAEGRAGAVFAGLRPTLERVLTPYLLDPPRVVGFSVFHLNREVSGLAARMFRERAPGTVIVFGGPSMLETAERARLPEGVADFILLGAADRRLPALVRAVRDGVSPPPMAGRIVGADRARPLSSAETFVADEPGEGIFPRYDDFDLTAYTQGYLPVLMARGCRFRCAFCNDQFVPYRRRDAAAVLAEIRHHVFVHGVTRFFFCDQSLDADVAHLAAVIDGLIAARLGITWWGQLNVRRGLTPDLLGRMKRSGCVSLAWGVESFSDPVLRAIRKPSTADLAEEALAITHAAGIPQLAYLIVGLPGETDATFAETLARVRRIAPLVTRLSIMPCQATPFAPLREDPEAYGIDVSGPDPKDHWRSRDGTNTHAKRMEWLARLARELLDLGVPFQSPVTSRTKFAELLGRQLPDDIGSDQQPG
jgi:radical SAM superfamily enzyme YgiQ (UPF0313 family)